MRFVRFVFNHAASLPETRLDRFARTCCRTTLRSGGMASREKPPANNLHRLPIMIVCWSGDGQDLCAFTNNSATPGRLLT